MPRALTTKDDRSRSNRFGVGMGPKIWEAGILSPWDRDVSDP